MTESGIQPDDVYANRPFRRFVLVRKDKTGVSGDGIVGCGLELPDKTVCFMWTDDSNPDGPDPNENSVYVCPGGMHDVREVHTRGGLTEPVLLDA